MTPLEERKYTKVHIAIESGYVWGTDKPGMPPEAYAKFEKEVRELLGQAGFAIKEASRLSSCQTVNKDKEYLYCHPMDLSGYLKEESIPKVIEAIKKAKTFTLREVREVEKVHDYTPEELRADLETKRPRLEQEILKSLTTKNAEKFFYVDLGRLKTDVHYLDCKESQTLESDFLKDILHRLVTQGKIKTSQDRYNNITYRTALKKEQLDMEI
jgi:hypothetical protein